MSEKGVCKRALVTSGSLKIAIGTLALLIKPIMIEVIPGYSFTTCLEKPVDIEVKMIFL